jgi:hypothetical protein
VSRGTWVLWAGWEESMRVMPWPPVLRLTTAALFGDGLSWPQHESPVSRGVNLGRGCDASRVPCPAAGCVLLQGAGHVLTMHGKHGRVVCCIPAASAVWCLAVLHMQAGDGAAALSRAGGAVWGQTRQGWGGALTGGPAGARLAVEEGVKATSARRASTGEGASAGRVLVRCTGLGGPQRLGYSPALHLFFTDGCWFIL